MLVALMLLRLGRLAGQAQELMPRVVCLASLVLVLASAGNIQADVCPAGTQILLVAGADYPGQWGVAQSAEPASLTLSVGQVVAVQLEAGQFTNEVASSETVYVPLSLRNAGNGADDFIFDVAAPAGWSTAVLFDDNANGIHDESETTETADTGNIAANDVSACFLRITTPAQMTQNRTVTVAASSTVDTGKTASVDIDITGSQAPLLQVTGPTSAAEYSRNSSHLRISGTATDNSGVASVQWANSTTGASGICTLEGSDWYGTVVLTGGENDISVTAYDPTGIAGAASLRVTYIESSPGDAWMGLSMVSMPIIPDETDPLAVAGFDNGYWVSFDAGTQSYSRYPEQKCLLSPVEDTPVRGFWTHFDGVADKPVGTIPRQDQPATIHLKSGWNLIGTPFITPVSFNVDRVMVQRAGAEPQSLRNSGSTVACLAWGWWQNPANPNTGSYVLVCDPSVIAGAVGELEPWRAYWIRAYANCDLILPPPGQ